MVRSSRDFAGVFLTIRRHGVAVGGVEALSADRSQHTISDRGQTTINDPDAGLDQCHRAGSLCREKGAETNLVIGHVTCDSGPRFVIFYAVWLEFYGKGVGFYTRSIVS